MHVESRERIIGLGSFPKLAVQPLVDQHLGEGADEGEATLLGRSSARSCF